MCNRSTNVFLRAGALVCIVYFFTRGLEKDMACFINGMAAGLYMVLMIVGLYVRRHGETPYSPCAWKRRLLSRIHR